MNVKLTSFFSISLNFVTKAKSVDSLRNTNPVEIFDKMKIDCNACLPKRRNFQGHRDWAFHSKFPVIFDLKFSYLLVAYIFWLLSKQCISQQCNGLTFFVRKHSNFLLLHFHKFLCFNLLKDLFLNISWKRRRIKKGNL